MDYTISFIFAVDQSTAPVNATLKILDQNSFSISNSPVQVQKYGAATTPPLEYLNVRNNGLNFKALPSTSTDGQSVQIVTGLHAQSNSLQINLSYEGVQVDAWYQILGYGSQVQFYAGNTTIQLPA